MRRRTLLSGALGLPLAGCSITSPTVSGTPTPYTPTPIPPLPGSVAARTAELKNASLLQAAAGLPEAPSSWWSTLAEVRMRHAAVLASVEPLRREPASAAPTAPAAIATFDTQAAPTALSEALAALRDGHLASANDGVGVTAAFWAALAASAEQGRLLIGGPPLTPRQAISLREPEVLTVSAAPAAVLARYEEAVYGLQSVLGRLPPGHPSRPAMATVIEATMARRDLLVAAQRDASADPDPGPGVFTLPTATTPDELLALAAALLEAVTAATAVWVASSDRDRPEAVNELIAAGSLGLPLGFGFADYPGWPDG